MADLASLLAQAGANFGTTTPQEDAATPPTMLDKMFGNLVNGSAHAVLAPGRALNSPVPMTSEEMIKPATDLAMALTLGAGAAPAEANTLRAGIRPYQNVPDSLMGYNRNGPQKGFDESNYPHTQDVQVVFPDREVMTDQIKGMNADHALERAHRNWQDAIHIFAPNKP